MRAPSTLRARWVWWVVFALVLPGCQLLTNFVRPLVDDPIDADLGSDAGIDAGADDAGEMDAG